MKYYHVEKLAWNKAHDDVVESDYGILSESDMKAVIKGFTNEGMFYRKKNCKYIYTVEEVEI